MDETYIKVEGKSMYLYRAVDKYGKTLDSCFHRSNIEPPPDASLGTQSR